MTDYGVRFVMLLAEKPEKVYKRSDVSKFMSIPFTVIDKIGRALKIAGIVEIYRGKAGGYRLKRPPEDVTLLEIIEALQGKIYLNKCLELENFCSRESICPVNLFWQEVNEKFKNLLRVSIKDLLKYERNLLKAKRR